MEPTTTEIRPTDREALSQYDQLKKGPRAVILIHERQTALEIASVFVGINGVDFWIKRGVEVDVPLPVALRLEEAKKSVVTFDPETNERVERMAPSYPFTWISGRPVPKDDPKETIKKAA